MCVYIYIYIYIYSQQHNKRGVAPRRLPDEARSGARRGTTRVSTNGVSANYILFDRDFWVLPLAYFYLSQSARAYLFPQSFNTFAAGPLVLTPFVRNQHEFNSGGVTCLRLLVQRTFSSKAAKNAAKYNDP